MKKLFILVIALVMAFAALPAFAQDKADWAFYGSVRMWTAWEMVDSDTPPQLSSIGTAGSFFQVATTRARAQNIGGDLKSDGDLAWMLQGNSRIGANVNPSCHLSEPVAPFFRLPPPEPGLKTLAGILKATATWPGCSRATAASAPT